MDGYAVRSDQVQPGASIELVGEIAIGQPAPAMPSHGCFKIGTGACVPAECSGIIPREQVDETRNPITLQDDLTFKPGQHIRRQGENAQQGSQVAAEGTTVTPPVASALAAFGQAVAPVFKQVRVAVLTTGDELLTVSASPEPWQIRDSNGETLSNALSCSPWITIVQAEQIKDDPDKLAAALQAASKQADLIITTGGVSMGDHDYLKPALLQAGGKVVYHKLPVRPGKPSLGGLIPGGLAEERVVPLVALPGNPVAVAVGVPLLIGPIARKLAGMNQPLQHRHMVRLNNPPQKTLPLWRYLPVRLSERGQAEMLSTKGSGDLAGAALADGYVEIPPNSKGPGPWAFYDVTL